jgi:Cu-Zn family superoxide dismutase
MRTTLTIITCASLCGASLSGCESEKSERVEEVAEEMAEGRAEAAAAAEGASEIEQEIRGEVAEELAEERMEEPRAVAVLSPTEGNRAEGTVVFDGEGDDVQVRVELAGLEPRTTHGFHIHEVGDCSADDASSAGGHFNPEDNPHGLPTAERRHAGDMGNLTANDDGLVKETRSYETFSVDGGDEPSIIGRAVILHADADTGNQPTGEAGSRLACGVIRPLGG